ncbi:MAG: hypothetical protein JOZ46_02230 [Candidatus Dormibacteraeota bacterium]|nr:hypothetical protein [Candidatus Dormibacteraeota bacterium]MBV9524614.1 hypothetical protein [Candidatus Dormibacteraeota bacterium]
MSRIVPMINAEFLKLRKRRGMLALAIVLTVGGVVVANVFEAIYHATSPLKYAAAGGMHGFLTNLTLFNITATLAAVILGATAGAQDTGSGVFRSLVATGQSRLKLAGVRIPGGLMLLLPVLLVAYGVELAGAFLFASGTPTPDGTTMLVGLGWLMAVAVLNFCVALGLAVLLQARGTAIGLLIAWHLALSRLIETAAPLGNWRVLVSSVATDRFLPNATDLVTMREGNTITVTIAVALVVVVAWIAVATALGMWRTVTQDA